MTKLNCKPDNYFYYVLLSFMFILYFSDILVAQDIVSTDTAQKFAEIQSRDGSVRLRVNYGNGCYIDRFSVNGNQVLNVENGISSAVKINNYWHLTQFESKIKNITADDNSVTIQNINYGPDTFKISENWTFTACEDYLNWRIQRTIPTDMIVDAAANSHWEFADMDTWTGAILDNGAVAWNKLLPDSFYTFGNHAAKVLFWNSNNGLCFEVVPLDLAGNYVASRFTRSPRDTLVFAQNLSETSMETRANLSRCLREDSIWKPFKLNKGIQSMTYRLSASKLDTKFDLGSFNGIDEDIVRDILNTIVRYGVIDSNLCGANGWRSGYICLHEQWYAQMAMALQDENYTRNLSETYNNFRDHAVLDSGRVLARFKDNSVDAMLGTYTENGFYEAQWGYLLDSQPDYVMVVSEQFHNTGDIEWVRDQKTTCEAVLEYMLKRDSDGDGLLEMINDYHSDDRGSDWIDIVWAAHENALVNAEMYKALTLWSEIEEIIGDNTKAADYEKAAARLKGSFNKDIKDGGFWNPDSQWYVYWRDKDDSIHGDNFVIPVNFTAIGYDLCDDKERISAILDKLEKTMQQEKLFSWPLCVSSFKPEEASAGNFPFPRYENGDIFLSWAELGTRCYARYNPDIAMKYINNIINQYKKDGLAFQRYSRDTQDGLGDDILAGNGMAVVGLYRNIFGIQPKYNRLYLEPHLPAVLAGTTVKYKLRDIDFDIKFDGVCNQVSANGFTICADAAYGINVCDDRLEYFTGSNSTPSLSFQALNSKDIKIIVDNDAIDALQAWTVQSEKNVRVDHFVYALTPGAKYKLKINSDDVENMIADEAGCVSFIMNLKANQPMHILIDDR